MLSRIHQKLGTAGFIIAIVALVAALGGSAWAAAGLNGKQKQEVKKIAKQFAGKNGKNGTNGANGANGAQGPAGPAGAKGDAGTPGSAGTPGATGPTGPTGEEGLQGIQGETGPTGPTGAFAFGSLPSNATLTGAWAFGRIAEGAVPESEGIRVPISFPLPLPSELSGAACTVATGTPPPTCQVHYINPAKKEVYVEAGLPKETEGTSAYCKGEAKAPTAEPGHLCVYAQQLTAGVNTSLLTHLSISKAGSIGNGMSVSGGYLTVPIKAGAEGAGAVGRGTWAVTAP